jgi:arylsulfatase A-like enzyme
VLALAVGVQGLFAAVSMAAEGAPPNILFAIADDWSYPHAGVYGDKVVHTPAFDRLAAEGVLFTHSFCASPSCTPSRAAILTGQAIHRLEESGNLWSILQQKFPVYPDLLEARGYFVGHTGKGWSPGSLEGSGRTRNPAGPAFKGFAQFLEQAPAGKPFCFWYGSIDPHRPYEPGTGAQSGLDPAAVYVPPFLPDTPEIRNDLLDYYFEVQRFDRDVGALLDLLEKSGRAKDTIVVVTSDNGLPFPRAKANLYDSGTRMPMVIRWPARFPGGRKVDALVSHADLAPTFLEAAGLPPQASMTGRSLLGLMAGGKEPARDFVFLERERHANVRKGDLSYPCRAVRSRQFLYLRNLRPERWPAGDPEMYKAVGPFGDVDGSPTKEFILARRDEPSIAPFFQRAFGKRPAEEFYDLERDPWQLTNIAQEPSYGSQKHRHAQELERWMKETADPRATGNDDRWDRFPYFGKEPSPQKKTKTP